MGALHHDLGPTNHDRCNGGLRGSSIGCKMAVLADGNFEGLSDCAQKRLRGKPWGLSRGARH